MDQETRFIKGYELLEPLGQGAFGAVHLARQAHVNRAVAIKVILPEHASRPEFIRRFETEARIIAQLEHLHIVPLYDYWRDETGAYLVMRLMKRSLKDLLESRSLSLIEAARVIEQIGAALTLAHRRGVIHRDLKPANILLDEDENAYLSDFGIAKTSQMDAGLTGTGVIIGSPGYLSPEQVKSEQITVQTDIYSLGIILYELLTGSHPFPDTPVGALMLKQVTELVPNLSPARLDLPAGLNEVIQRATAKDLVARYPDITSFLDDFQRTLQKPQIRGATPSIPSFAVWLIERRLALGLSQVDVARLSGCSPGTVDKIESGERRPTHQLALLLVDSLAGEQDNTAEILSLVSGSDQSSFSDEAVASIESLEKSSAGVFVARHKELDRLDDLLDKTMHNQGKVVFVVGEAGYGKSTLLNGFTDRVLDARAGVIVARGSCNAFSGMGDPYLPFRDVLAMLRGDFETQWSAGMLSRKQAASLLRFAPRVKEVLFQEGPDLVNVITPGATANISAGERDQLFIFEQFTQVLHTLSREKPLILLMEDLQWADSATLSLLFHIGMRLTGSRLLIIGTYRPSDVSLGKRPGSGGTQHPLNEMISEFRRRYGNIEINLSEVSGEEGRAFVEELLDTEPNRLDEAFRSALFHRTRGHPLFTVELLRAMQDRGDIYKDEQEVWLTSPTLDWEALPARVEAVIDQRISRLEEDLREILTVASVEGEIFTAQVLAQVIEIDERTLLRRLSGELEMKHRLIAEQGEIETPEGVLARYKFGHVLFQEYMIHTISRAERRVLHRAVAGALEALYGIERPEIAPQLAHHYRLAGDRGAAVKYTLKAAALAENVYAFDEAVQHLHRALDSLPPGEQANERQAILERLGDDYALLGDWPRALSFFERAQDLWHIQPNGNTMDSVRLHRKIGETVVNMTWYQDKQRFEHTGHNSLLAGLELIQGAPPHPETAVLLTVLANEAWLIHTPADWDLAEDYARQAVEMAETLDAVSEMSAALEALGNVYGGQGKFRERLAVSLRRLELSDSPDFGDRWQKANILQQTGFAYLQVGDYREALPYLYQAEEISANIQALDQQYRALRHQATCWFRLDEWGKVFEIEEKRVSLVEKYPNFYERVGPT